MKAIQHVVPFNNDFDDRVMRAGNGLASEPRKSAVSTYEPSMYEAAEPRVGLWLPTDKRQKPEYNDEAANAAATIAASPSTEVLRESSKATAESVRVRQALGQPGGFMRSDEVMVETDSFRITRSSDGTVRNDLHCRPDLKAVEPMVKLPSNPSIGKTLSQEEIDQL